jgi:ribosomal protein L3 glutamine methyltransferase
MTSLVGTIEEVADQFAASDIVYGHGTTNPWDEAVALVLGVTGLPDDQAAAHFEIDAQAAAEVSRLARRRIEDRVPIGYLVGSVNFYGRRFEVQPGIVIPRSPIAQLVEGRLRPWLTRDPRSVLDMCTGSGCLGILCALAFPDAAVTLVDVDPAAIALARRNVAAHGLESRVEVVASDLFADLELARFDLIVSNPPYVDEAEMAALPPEYRHEPARGLAGGPDGLDLVARLLESLPERLAPGGVFVCEVGASSPALLARYPELPFLWPDLPDGGEGVFILEGIV